MTAAPEPRRDAVPTPTPPRGGAGRLTLIGCATLLAAATATATIALAVGRGRPGWPQAVAFGAVVCLPGSLVAWVVARTPTRIPARAVAMSLGATVLRIIPPLAGLAWLSLGPRGSPTPERGGILVVFYLVLLATDILLHMMGIPASRRPPAAPD